MIGVGPHTMSTADWIFLVALQVGLIALAVLATWLAIRATGGGDDRRGRRAASAARTRAVEPRTHAPRAAAGAPQAWGLRR